MLVDSYTRALKRYDPDLYAGRTKDGALCVFRRVKRWEVVSESEHGFKLFDLKQRSDFVIALTSDWKMSGQPVSWGIDKVVSKIKEMDTQSNEALFEELDRQNERADEAKKRDFRNNAEAFFADYRKEFADTVDQFTGCIHSLSKDEPRKRNKDRSIK